MKKNLWRITASIASSLLVLALMIRLATNTGDDTISRTRLLIALRDTVPLFVGLYAIGALAQTFFRTLRYRLLLRAAGANPLPGLSHLIPLTLARNMFVDMLPARLGELTYVAMLNRGYRIRGEICLSSLALSFLFDLVALLFIVALVLANATTGLAGRHTLIGSFIAIAAVAGLLALGLFHIFPAAMRRLQQYAGPHRTHRTQAVMDFLARLASAILLTRRAGILGRVLLLSLGVRCGKYAGLYAAYLAVTRIGFPDFAAAPPAGVLCALIGAEAAASLPIPTFMGFGSYEAGGLLAMTLLGFPAAGSILVLLTLHIWSQTIDYALGGIGLIAFFLRAAGLAPAADLPALPPEPAGSPNPRNPIPTAQPRRRQILAAGLALAAILTAAAALCLQTRNLRKLGTTTPPPIGHAITPPVNNNTNPLALTLNQRQGFIVWSSNRSGSHDLFLLSLPDLALRQLTDTPHTDTLPRIAPDGARVAFARSQLHWVSQRDPIPWDTYVLDLKNGTETLVASNAFAPSWAPDGRRLFFQRNGNSVVEHDIESARERILLSAGQGDLLPGDSLQTPDVCEERRQIATTIRGQRRMTALCSFDGSVTRIADGCQIAWAPNNAFLYYVDKGGLGINQVWRYDLASSQPTPWLDLPAPFSHEYFPRLSADGAWLVLGASAGGHEHDAADYEIFLWPVGSPPASAQRLTWHSGNDCWPDIYLAPTSRRHSADL